MSKNIIGQTATEHSRDPVYNSNGAKGRAQSGNDWRCTSYLREEGLNEDWNGLGEKDSYRSEATTISPDDLPMKEAIRIE